jgi:hypothetical protein
LDKAILRDFLRLRPQVYVGLGLKIHSHFLHCVEEVRRVRRDVASMALEAWQAGNL